MLLTAMVSILIRYIIVDLRNGHGRSFVKEVVQPRMDYDFVVDPLCKVWSEN
jgi:hypothetical protein